jgi:hypothetical protein
VNVLTGATDNLSSLINLYEPLEGQVQFVELFWRRPGGNLP